MDIKLIQDWKNVDDIYKAGTKLEVPDELGQSLIEQEVAEKLKPEPGKCDVVKEIDKTEKKTEEQIDKLVEKKLNEKFPDIEKKRRLVHQDEQARTGGFKSFGEFAQSVRQGQTNIAAVPKLEEYCKSTGMNIAINADGGFLIPPEFSTALLTAMAQAGVLAPKCLNFPVNNNLALPFVNITSQATSWTGGMTIYKPGEGVAKTASVPQMAKAELHLHKMTGVVYATDELLSDSPVALETFLSTMASTEFALTKDEDIVNGSGAGECLGYMNAPCLVSVGKETGQAADTIVTENVLKMFSRLSNPSRSKSQWLIAADAMPQIATLSISVGTGGSTVFLADLTNPLGATLLGRPIIWSPHSQTIGDKGDIAVGDFSQYITITKAGAAGMETATSIHLKFLENETIFRFEVRFDGQPWWASAITPKHGSNTVSPFVTLDERA
jgi:HK97 family phage major capsid protein